MSTKPVPVSDLSGPALDWAVARCEGYSGWDGEDMGFPLHNWESTWVNIHELAYSSDWSRAGPIIERESISIVRCDDESIRDSKGFYCGKYEPRWAAVIGDRHSTESDYGSQGDYWGLYYKITSSAVIGPTPIVAAMRCYVASRLGDTVEIPEELV